MSNEFSFFDFSDETKAVFKTVLDSDTKVALFQQLFRIIKNTLPQVVVRGREGEIIGVSNPGERYIFYIIPGEEEFIKFKSGPKMQFSVDNAEELLAYAENEAEWVLSNPEALKIVKKTDNSIAKVDQVTNEDCGSEDEPFCTLLNIDPTAYEGIPITQALFGTRAYNCLMRAGIGTIDQLFQCKETDLRKFRQLGRTTMRQVEHILYDISNGTITLEPEEQENNEEQDETIEEEEPSWVSSITGILEMIADGVDPTSGEVIDCDILKNAPSFQDVLKKLRRTYAKREKGGGLYKQYEESFPHHAIVMREGYIYTVHNRSAVVLNETMDYNLFVDNLDRLTTGGPDYEKIARTLRDDGLSFIILDQGEIVDQNDENDPFIKYGITDDVVRARVDNYFC